MAWISDDYICTNELCSMHGERVEHFGKKEKRDTYRCAGYVPGSPPEDHVWDGSTQAWFDECNQLLKRVPSGVRVPHISWSTWRI